VDPVPEDLRKGRASAVSSACLLMSTRQTGLTSACARQPASDFRLMAGASHEARWCGRAPSWCALNWRVRG